MAEPGGEGSPRHYLWRVEQHLPPGASQAVIRLRVKGLREQQGGEGQGKGWEPHPRALLQGAEGRGPRLPGGLWPFPGGFSLEGWRWGKMTQPRPYLQPRPRLQPTPSRSPHPGPGEPHILEAVGVSQLPEPGWNPGRGPGWGGPVQALNRNVREGPLPGAPSAPGPPAWREPPERAAGGNAPGPRGREGAASRPGEGPASAPRRQELQECRGGGPETLKQGRQSQRPAGNTCERASPRPSLAPGSSRLQDAAGSSFWGGPAPGMANLLFL